MYEGQKDEQDGDENDDNNVRFFCHFLGSVFGTALGTTNVGPPNETHCTCAKTSTN